MKKWFSLLLAASFTLLASAAPLFENGKTDWKIIVPEKSNSVIDYASSELADTLKKVSGAAFAVQKNKQAQFNIILGTPASSPEIAKLQKEFKLPDAEAIDTIAVYARGNDLYLAGNNDRSVLYAVYTFLQKQLGVRWLWPGDDGEFITPKKKYNIPAKLAINFTPSFKIRAMSPCHWHRHVPTEIWMARNFLNGDSRTTSIRDKAGFIRIGGGHRVVVYNRKKVFKTNPELFSLIGGRRDMAGYVGCWSNPEFTRQVVENVSKLVKKGNLELLNLFPGDITLRCECEKCTVNPDRSSRWYDYYYQLITELKKEFPKLKFAGIAYQEYRDIPKTEVKGLEYVEYCHYNRCYAHKLNDPKCKINVRSMEEIKKWQAKAPFAIYGYEFDIFSPSTLLPNWYATADALRVYRDLKAVRLKTEMSVFYGKGLARHELAPQINRLANWIWANMAWNADADVDEMIKDFCRTVYGAKAAPFMVQYFQELGKAWVNQKGHPTYFGRKPLGSAQLLFNAKRIKLCRSLINKAKAAIGKSDKRRMEDIDIDDKIFQKWEEYFNISGNRTIVTPPYMPANGSFDKALALPLKSKNPAIKPNPTTVKMYWDDKGVNILAECLEPDMKNIRKSSTERDQGVWKDANLEMMIDPGDGEPFRHMVVTAGNNRYDAMGNDPAWNPEWSSEVVCKDDRWIARIHLPFASLGKFRKDLTWQFMIIRNGKPVAVGFPTPSHMDITAAGTVVFSKKAKEVKKLVWISGAQYPQSMDPHRKFVLENGWNCQTAAGEKAAWEIDYSDVNLIYIEPYRTYFKKDFWQTKIAPAVKNGATLVFRSYHWLGMLGKDFGDKTFAVVSKENSHKIRKPTFIDPEFAKSGHDLNRYYKSCGTVTFIPKYPEKWTVLMTQLTKDNKQGASVIARRFGKGKIFIMAQIRGTIGIIENMVNYTPPEK